MAGYAYLDFTVEIELVFDHVCKHWAGGPQGGHPEDYSRCYNTREEAIANAREYFETVLEGA